MQAQEFIVKLSSETEVLEALKQIRQEIYTNEKTLTQLLPTIPTILEIAKNTKNEQIRLYALFTVSWFTKSETESYLQMLVDAGCIPIFCDSISAEASDDMLITCSSALHNLAYNSISRRDQIISLGVLKKLANLLTTTAQRHMTDKVVEHVTMTICTLMSMDPTPELQYAKEVIPALHNSLCNKKSIVRSYAAEAIDNIASGSKEHKEAATGPLHICSVLVYYLAEASSICSYVLSIITKASSIKKLATAFVTGSLLTRITKNDLGVYKPCVVLRNVASFCDNKRLLSKFLEAEDCITFLVLVIRRKWITEDPQMEEAREYAVEALQHLVKFANAEQVQKLMSYKVIRAFCYVIVYVEPSTMLHNAVEALYLMIKQIPRAEYLDWIDVVARKRLDSLGIRDGDRKLSLMCRRVMDEAGFPIVTLFKGMRSNSASSCTRNFLDIQFQMGHHNMKKRKRGDEVQQTEEDEQPAKVLRLLSSLIQTTKL